MIRDYAESTAIKVHEEIILVYFHFTPVKTQSQVPLYTEPKKKLPLCLSAVAALLKKTENVK